MIIEKPRTLDVAYLPAYSISTQAPLWWGQLCIVFIEGTMFLILIAAYLYTRLRVDVWPPPGDQFPHITLPTVALLPLVVSAVFSYVASEGAKENRRGKMLLGLSGNLVFATIFFAMRLVEWHSFNFNWKSDIHGSYIWSFLALHSFDYVGDCIFTLVLLLCLLTGRFGEKQRLGVHVDSVVWYFLVAIWIPIYAVVYLGPHFLQ